MIPAPDARTLKLLDAAFTVFTRYGFRKTSMEDVARAAHVSRQALYLRFPTKEALFIAALRQALQAMIDAAAAELGGAASLVTRLTSAFDVWCGRAVGLRGTEAADIEEVAMELAPQVADEYERQFLDAVTKAVRGAGLVGAYGLAGLSARQLATTFYATAKGLKQRATTREAFREELTWAARILCAPLG